jgi:hypothetical protein
MKMKYVTGTGCVMAAALAFAMTGCKPNSETSSSDLTDRTNTLSSSMSTNADISATPNAVTAGSSVTRGQYDTSLTTNLHNADMDTNAVMTNAAGMAVGDVRRGQYDTNLRTNLRNAEMAVEGAANAVGITNLAGDMATMVTNMISAATTNVPDTNMPTPPAPTMP